MDINEEIDLKTAQRNVDAFLVDNPELEQLTAKLSSFNLFNILRAERAELKHSNVLSWLLDPRENHGLDDRFLRRFISKFLLENDDIDISLSPARAELMPLGDTEVLREWKNIDILIKSEANNLCVLIENKIRSKESAGQLVRYKEAVQHEYPNYEVIPILLTIEGDDPSGGGVDAGFLALSYIQVLEIIDGLFDQYRSHLSEDVQIFLEHYLSILRRLTMQDEELVSLCKAVYRKHRDAIELIVQYGSASQILDTCNEAIASMPGISFTQQTKNRVWFLPNEMKNNQKETKLNGWGILLKKYPVMCWLHYAKKRGSLQLSMEVGPIEDYVVRQKFLKNIKTEGFTFREKEAFRDEAKYTRFLKVTKKLRLNDEGDVDDDEDYLSGVVQELWKKAWKDGCNVIPALKEMKKSL